MDDLTLFGVQLHRLGPEGGSIGIKVADLLQAAERYRRMRYILFNDAPQGYADWHEPGEPTSPEEQDKALDSMPAEWFP